MARRILGAAVGKTAWWESLDTADRGTAEIAVLEPTGRCKRIIKQLDAAAVASQAKLVTGFVDKALAACAERHGSMDRAVVHELVFLTMHVATSWSLKPVLAGCGEAFDDGQLAVSGMTFQAASFDEGAEHQAFELRARLIEGRGIADGLVYQEVARRLLARSEFEMAYPLVVHLASVTPDTHGLVNAAYDEVARTYLARLAEHAFEGWPEGVLEALAPLGQDAAAGAPIAASPAAEPQVASPSHTGLRAKRLSEALVYWRQHRSPGASAVTEATRAVGRFVALFGDVAVGDITREQIIAFRGLLMNLPPQTELAKVEAAGLTLKGVIEAHGELLERWDRGERDIPEPGRLAPGSIKKDIGALSQVLGKIGRDLGQDTNVASKIEVAGYSKTRNGQKKPRLPFTPAMMQALFDSPLFTGCAGERDVQRTRPGSHLYQDVSYWAFLFGVTGGPRLEEIGQVAVDDVHRCDLRRTFGNEFEGEITFVHITGTGAGQAVKNDESDRYVVIHPKLIELGFNDYVAQRRAAGAKRLFNLTPDSNGKHTKGLSNRLNRYIDRVVTEDPRYVFHSMRHEFTDRAELSEIPARVANSIKGHANATEGDKYGLVTLQAQHVFLAKLKLEFIDWPRLLKAARDASNPAAWLPSTSGGTAAE